MTVSCTNELAEIVPDDQPQENELRLVFSSSTDGEVYPTTKAIATAEENAIDNLTIYVFASNQENGTYYLLDTWKSDEAQDNGQQKFKLQPSGANYKASIYPREIKDAKYLKLYCVANSDIYSDKNGSVASPQQCSEAGFNQGSPTAMTIFDTYFTQKVETAGEPLKTPLVMTGIMSDPLHVTGNYGTVSVELKRRVARFDIDNNAARTKLTIKSIGIEQAQSVSYLFNTKDGSDAGSPITYPEVNYTELDNANLGVTTSAMYVYPTAGDKNLMLVIKGLYAGKNEVTYRLRVARTDDEGTLQDITIEPNHRYSLRISEVTTSEIVGYFEVEDWVDGGGVEVKPDYDQKPEIIADGVKAVDGKDPFTGLTNADKFWTPADSTIRVAKDGQFTVTVKAPGQCSVKSVVAQDFVTKAVSAVNDWLSVGATPTVTEEDGMRYSTFTFTVKTTVTNNAVPFDLTFVNDAASVDPAFQLKYRVLPPAFLNIDGVNIAAASNSTYPNNTSNGSITTTKGSEAMTLNLGKKYYVDVCSPYLAVPTCEQLTSDYLEITEVARNATAKTVTYCFNFKAIPEDIDSKGLLKVTFKNTFDASGADVANPVSVDYTLTLNSSEAQVDAAAPDNTTYPNSAGSSLSITTPASATAPQGVLSNVANDVLYIAFAKEMLVEVPEDVKDNVTVTLKSSTKTRAAAAQYVYEIKMAKTLTESAEEAGAEIKNVSIKFKNKVDPRKVTTLALSIKKQEAVLEAKNPTDSSTYANSEGCTLTVTTATAPTASMVNTVNNKLHIAFDKEVVAVVPEEYQSNITVTKKTSSAEFVYEILIKTALDEGSVSAGQKIKDITINFQNKLDTRKVTPLVLSVMKAGAE